MLVLSIHIVQSLDVDVMFTNGLSLRLIPAHLEVIDYPF